MENRVSTVRFGLMCRGMVFPGWQARAIKLLLEHKGIELPLLIIDQHNHRKDLAESRGYRQWLWRAYHKCYVTKKSKADHPQDLRAILKHIPVIRCQTINNGETEYFEEEAVQAVEAYQLDFILHFGFGNVRGKMLNAARFGLWSFHHGDQEKYRGRPSCFWEIYNGEHYTGSILQRLTDQSDQNVMLKRGFFKTHLSYIKNRDQAFLESAGWPLQICIDIQNDQLDILMARPSQTVAPVYHYPTNTQLLKFVLKFIYSWSKKIYRSLFFVDYWNIGVAKAPIQAFLDPQHLPPVVWYPNPPKEKFLADPFGMYHQNTLNIVYEEFPFAEKLGKIATLQFDRNKFGEDKTCLQEKFHLSYPFLFEYKDEVYCIPETYQANQVRLYKAVTFPYEWTFDRVLIKQYAGIDNTLFFHDDYWWMFSTDKYDGHHYNLKLFYAKSPLEEWQEHPKNPVKTDIRSARPAGTVFRRDGDIFRPAMDYSAKVEGRIVINKILRLSTTDFAEEAYCVVDPYPNTPFSDKIHTLCAAGNYTIIDGAKELFVLSNTYAFRYKLHSIVKKISSRWKR